MTVARPPPGGREPLEARNERPEICRACGGECCLTRPGIEEPDRFLAAANPASELAGALRSRDWVLLRHVGVPWTDGRPPDPADRYRTILYPRPATVDERSSGHVFAGAERSPCVFHGPRGCALPFAGRPRMCRELEPSAVGDCESTWDQRSAALAWLPWQDLVARALALAPGTPVQGS